MDPVNILPPEVCVQILQEINGAQDWLNMYRAHPSFQEMLAEKRQEVLFKEVLPHVSKYLQEKWHKKLRLRLVSRQWKTAVDGLLGDQDLRGHPLLSNYSFKTATKLSTFLQRFENHPTNPFIGKSMELHYHAGHESAESRMEYPNLVLRLMSKFGDEIRQMRLTYFMRDFPQSENFFLRLFNVLQLVPNLEKLEIRDSPFSRRQTCSDVVQQIEAFGLPVIHNLISLTLYVSKTNQNEWINVLIRICSNPNTLTEVHALLYIDRVQDLEDMRNAHLPLTNLTWVSSLPIDYVATFQAIEKFKNTLTSLCIRNTGLKRIREFRFRVDLPHLKSLDIDYCSSLNFFANMSNLEVLRVRRWDGPATNAPPNQVIKIRWIENRMLESNIWQIFPKLREFRLEGKSVLGKLCAYIYTREQLNRRIQNQADLS